MDLERQSLATVRAEAERMKIVDRNNHQSVLDAGFRPVPGRITTTDHTTSSCLIAFADQDGRLIVDVYGAVGVVEVRVPENVTVMRQGRRVA